MKTFKIEEVRPIVNFMGWNDMPENVACDAVTCIVRNNICCQADCTEDLISSDEELSCIKDMIATDVASQDALWLSLFIDDYDSNNNLEMHNFALTLRGDIEREMRKGSLFAEARREYDI